MSFQTQCNRYLETVRQTLSDPNATPELSLLPHLRTFLQNVTGECFDNPDITFTLEPRNIDQIGRPDFIASDGLLPIGYIEAEAYGTDLNNLTGHAAEQNDRFRENLDNFILTNFVDFQLWRDGQLRTEANIETEIESLETLLEGFLTGEHLQISSPEVLAKYLARRTRELHTQIAMTLTDENSQIYSIYTAFRETLLSTLTYNDFADMYAQTLTYGLFAARSTLPNATYFFRHTAAEVLPDSNPFLKELFYQVASPKLAKNVKYILDDIATLLRNVSTEMLRTTFTARNPLEDPVIHFYETFLKEYNPNLRFERGVFYTPPQVISYIVISIDNLLKTYLNRPIGLADENTLILDPATGTGGFLLEVLHHIREFVTSNYGSGDWNQYINADLVKRIFGFELLIAPYTIAHLKLSLFLHNQGWNSTERLGIYLTNTMEQPAEMVESQPFAPFISDEANEALAVKRDKPLLVILGNPPYQRHSANPSRDSRGRLTFIGRLIEDYKQVDGEPLDEATEKALQDDYVKFIRWAQWRIDKNGEGVIGYIVNNNFLEAITLRGMRQSLIDSFNAIYNLNLHGSRIKPEDVQNGEEDENVFDIGIGVSILLCVKEFNNSEYAKVYYTDMLGSREEKYNILTETDVQSTEWRELHPTSPEYLFVPQGKTFINEYKSGWKINDMYQTSSIGIVTARDRLTIHGTAQELIDTVTDFVSISVEEAREKYKLRKDSQDWQVSLAQSDIRNNPDLEQHLNSIFYRPFDIRWTYYTGHTNGFHCRPRPKVMPNLCRDNYALCVCRIVKSPMWQHVLITDNITENCYISNTTSESAHVFPLYLYPDSEGLGLETERTLNFKPAFLEAFSETLGLSQTSPYGLPDGIAPEEILAYIYAVLYSPTYRERYFEFLKYDFPRIPLPSDIDCFRSLAALGQELIDRHLLKQTSQPEVAPASRGPLSVHRFEGLGDGVVERVDYENGHVWINDTQYFTDVPVDVWEYEVGAYQVCKKWLKDRRGNVLSHEEGRHYRSILVAIAETLRVMDEIDGVLW